MTTDILFLRKRAPGAEPAGHAWRKLETIDTEDGPIEVNEYFAHHPEMMLGKMKLSGTMYRGAEPTLEGELTPGAFAPRHHVSAGRRIHRLRTKEGPLPGPFFSLRALTASRMELLPSVTASSSSAAATASSPSPSPPLSPPASRA